MDCQSFLSTSVYHFTSVWNEELTLKNWEKNFDCRTFMYLILLWISNIIAGLKTILSCHKHLYRISDLIIFETIRSETGPGSMSLSSCYRHQTQEHHRPYYSNGFIFRGFSPLCFVPDTKIPKGSSKFNAIQYNSGRVLVIGLIGFL